LRGQLNFFDEAKRLHKFYRCEDGAIARYRQMIGQEGPVDLSARHSIPIRVTITMRRIAATLAVVGALLFSAGSAWADYHQLCREKNYGEYD